MKLRICILVLFGFFVAVSSAGAFDPVEVPVHPALEKIYDGFFPPAVIKVTDGVYVARGYNRDNPVLIVGRSGLIVIDPGESIGAAEEVKNAFNAKLDNIFDKKPVKGIIYTHHHDCHINGASVFADEHTEIIGQENLMKSLFDEWWGQMYPSRAEGGVKMGGIIFQNDPGWYAGYVLAGPQILGPSGFLPPTTTVKDELETTIAGVKLKLISAPAESRDVIVIWLPDKKVLIEIGIIYEAFPALVTMRGSGQRNPLDYISSLKICRDLEPEYLVKLHGNNPVTKGKKNIQRFLTDFSDAIQFVHDQTVQYINKGLTPGEIMNLIKLPPHLANSSYLQETYGRIDWDVFHIFRYYRGYYTGQPRDLFPQSPKDEADMAAELAGGVDKLAAKAAAAYAAGNFEWALKLADYALLIDEENASAFVTKKDAMLKLAEKTMNSQARNMLLSDYLLMTGQADELPIGNPKLIFSMIDPNAVNFMPMDSIFRIMAVNLNADKSEEKDIVAALKLTDINNNNQHDYKNKHKRKHGGNDPSRYSLYVRKGILEVDSDMPKKAEFKIITNSMTWKQLVLGKIQPEDAVSDGQVVIAGADPEEFYDFMELFDE
jgi:alkyl sulfatase BDS1-like metallo-beta-lactamase superfamily hydrolase